jgi:hypothetical protein
LQKNIEGYSIRLHLDNAAVHNSRLSSGKTQSANAQRVPHPRYNPDLAPSDFFRFGYLKEKLSETSFTMSDDPIVARREISEIPERVLKHVLTNWIMRLSCVITKGGEYHTK